MGADLVRVRPAKGLRVIDPATRQPLPAEGAAVARSGYWTRRLQQGDVVALDSAQQNNAGEQTAGEESEQ
jgi:hypothetical protein